MGLFKTIILNAFWNSTFQILNVIISVALVPLLINYLGIYTYSTYIFHFSVIGLFSLLADFGQKSIIVFELSESKNQNSLIYSFLKLQTNLFLITTTLYLTFLILNSYDPRYLFFLIYFSYEFFYPNWLFIHLNKTQLILFHSLISKVLLIAILITFKQFYSENLFGVVVTISLLQFLPVIIGLCTVFKTHKLPEIPINFRTFTYHSFSSIAAIKIFDAQYINIFNLVLSIYGLPNTPALHDVITKVTKPVSLVATTVINSSLTSYKYINPNIRYIIFATITLVPTLYGLFLILAYKLKVPLLTDLNLFELLLTTLTLTLLGLTWAIGDLIFISNKLYNYYFKTGFTRIFVLSIILLLEIIIIKKIEIYQLYYALLLSLLCDIIYKLILIHVSNRV